MSKIYRHYKGNLYEYQGECLHSETLEEMVIYKALYGEGKTWVRPKAMFFEDVTLPDGNVVPRFAPLSSVRCIIWDLDGTLMDTLQDLHLAVNHALATYQLPLRTLEETRMSVGNGVRTLIRRSIPEGEGNPLFEQVFDAFKQYYLIHCQDHTCLYPGIANLLKELKQKGIRMAVVSNKLQSGVDELYEVWFKDTIEVAIGERPDMNRKPAPDMVNLAISQMGIEKKDAIYIGDSDVDIATARNSDLPCISVLWGFRDRAFLSEHGATLLAERPEDIKVLLRL